MSGSSPALRAGTPAPYSAEELGSYGPPRAYADDASEAAFLVGGIGTGCYSIGARGEMRDWEIFNRPGKGNRLPYTFFALSARGPGVGVARVLEARLHPPFSSARGYESNLVAGLPRFAHSQMTGRFPFVTVELQDPDIPLGVTLEAFNPFIPLDADSSGIPAGIMEYRAKNLGDVPLDVAIAGSLFNAAGFNGYDVWGNMNLKAPVQNVLREGAHARGVWFHAPSLDPTDITFGSLALATDDPSATFKPEWIAGQWIDGIHDFWDDFCSDGRLERISSTRATTSRLAELDVALREGSKRKNGSLAISHRLLPGEEAVYRFVLAWHFPNRTSDWNEDACRTGDCACGTVRNYYATRFADAWAAAEHVLEHRVQLTRQSRSFSDAVFSSTLPDYVLDAVTANLAVLKSPTCFRVEDGTMLAYEGCHDGSGCCPGSCTHVWNYAQAMAYLFPDLERSMRRVDFLKETDPQGQMQFRGYQVLSGRSWGFLPAVDGQLGTIMRVYREWMLSGDDAFLRELWPAVVSALDFSLRYWDKDGDVVPDGQQHVDYDIEFYGPNPLGALCLLGALKAAAEAARYLGDKEHQTRYQELLERGAAAADSLLWNGEYYVQRLPDVDAHKYQIGEGCLSDQLIGQFLAFVCGLGHLLPQEHVKEAARSIYRYNFRTSFNEHHNAQRTYALNDERGLLLASWPLGGRPRFPFIYSDEVWTRVEYHVAATLIYEGLVDEGLTVVKAARERFDGHKRNPWDEFECGHHYSGTMSSWSLLVALSGFTCNASRGFMSFDPVINRERFSCFWSNGRAWGTYSRVEDPQTGKASETVNVLYGNPDGASAPR